MTMKFLPKNIIFYIALPCILVISSTYLLLLDYYTAARRELNQNTYLEYQLADLLSNIKYDNNLLQSKFYLSTNIDELQHKKLPIYLATYHKKLVAVIMNMVTYDGYNGYISILVAIDVNHNTVLGVRVIDHNETPGLGDQFDKDNWLYSFFAKNLLNTPNGAWQVKKYGGIFDSWTGATITPNAIIKLINKALNFYQKQKIIIYRKANDV